jgi:ABC-type multidrug transport system fused ATPase/permease subunit
MQQTAELGNELVSVERMVEYLHLQPEECTVEQNAKENWKALDGRIEFKDVDAAYIHGVPVLRNVNLIIYAGEKVRRIHDGARIVY